MKRNHIAGILLAGLFALSPAGMELPAAADEILVDPIAPEVTEGKTDLFDYERYSDHIVLTNLKYSGQAKIEIPSEIDGLPVTEIGQTCCHGPALVEEWVIPEGVRVIRRGAFGNCYSVARIVLPSTLEEIGDRAFADCASLTEVVWNGCTPVIGDGVFSKCTSLAQIAIPEGVTEIGSGMFYGCTALAEVTLPSTLRCIRFKDGSMDSMMAQTAWLENQPEGVLYLGNFAIGYKGDASITDLAIADGTAGIAEGAFRFLSGLVTIQIPDSVRYIGSRAFPRLTEVTEVRLPRDLETIEPDSFFMLPGVKAFTIAEDAPNFAVLDGILYRKDFTEIAAVPTGVENPVLADELVSIPAGVFLNCGITEITIPDGVDTIRENTFGWCMKLERVELPSGLKHIEDLAFRGTAIRHITLPDGLESIGDYAFSGCEDLQEAIIPDSVTYLGEQAFDLCKSLRKVRLPAGVSRIESEEMWVICENPNDNPDLGLDYEIIDELYYISMFNGCSSIETLIFPKELTYVGTGTFQQAALRDTWYSGTQEEWEQAEIEDRELYGTVHFGYDESSEVRGDVTLDNECTVLDVVYLERHLHGDFLLNAAAFRNADLNGDGEVDVFDLSLLKRSLVESFNFDDKPCQYYGS